MSRPQDLLLRRLCAQAETLTQARVFLHTASLKTGPGTGYDLGEGASGLPAICAYIASQELGNADVSEKVAQTASCLNPKIFKQTLKTVRAALAASAAEARAPKPELTYEALVQENKLGRKAFVSGCMKDVEKAVIASRMLPDELKPPCEALRVTVFHWTCSNLLKIRKVRLGALLREHDVDERDYDNIVQILESTCQEVADKIRQKVAELIIKVRATATTVAPSPSKPTLEDTPSKPPRSPSKSALKGLESESSAAGTPTHKRKVAFVSALEDDADVLEAPSKRPRVASPVKTLRQATAREKGPAPLRALPTRPQFFPNPMASSSRTTSDGLERSDDQRAPSEPDEQSEVTLLNPEAVAPATTPIINPSTPRHRPTPPRPAPGAEAVTPMTKQQSGGSPARRCVSRTASFLEDDTEPPRPRRFRPVFLDQRQWIQRDARIEGEWKLAEAQMRRIGGPEMEACSQVAVA